MLYVEYFARGRFARVDALERRCVALKKLVEIAEIGRRIRGAQRLEPEGRFGKFYQCGKLDLRVSDDFTLCVGRNHEKRYSETGPSSVAHHVRLDVIVVTAPVVPEHEDHGRIPVLA